MNVLVMISHIHIYMYVYMKCVLTNGFMRSASPDHVHLSGPAQGRDKLFWYQSYRFRRFYELTLNYV